MGFLVENQPVLQQDSMVHFDGFEQTDDLGLPLHIFFLGLSPLSFVLLLPYFQLLQLTLETGPNRIQRLLVENNFNGIDLPFHLLQPSHVDPDIDILNNIVSFVYIFSVNIHHPKIGNLTCMLIMLPMILLGGYSLEIGVQLRMRIQLYLHLYCFYLDIVVVYF